MLTQSPHFLIQVNTMKLHLVGGAIAAISLTAFAQSPPALVVSPEQGPVAKHSCAKPAMPDASKSFAAEEANAFVRTLETFRNCVQNFSEGQKAIATEKQKEAEALRLSAVGAFQAATAAAAAADAAAKDYNTFSEQAVKIVTPKAPDAQKKPVAIEPVAPRPQRGY